MYICTAIGNVLYSILEKHEISTTKNYLQCDNIISVYHIEMANVI